MKLLAGWVNFVNPNRYPEKMGVKLNPEEHYSERVYAKINQLCVENNEFAVSFESFSIKEFDLSVLQKIPNVHSLIINLFSCEIYLHPEALFELKNLKRLSVHGRNFKSMGNNLFEYENLRNLISLDFSDLSESTVDLNFLKNLKELRYLTLKSKEEISTEFLNYMPHLVQLFLYELTLKSDFNEVNNPPPLIDLWMNRVKTSNCLDSIAVFENLIELRFEDLSVDELNFKEVMPSLKNLLIDKASTPMTFKGLENLINLDKFSLSEVVENQSFFRSVNIPAWVKSASFTPITSRETFDNYR